MPFAPISGARRQPCSTSSTASACTRPIDLAFPSSRCRSSATEDIDAVGRFLFDNGIYVTLAAYPLVPRSEVGFRIQVTAANTDAEIEQLIDVLGRLVNVFDLQPARKERACGVRRFALTGTIARTGLGLVPGRRCASLPPCTSSLRRWPETGR